MPLCRSGGRRLLGHGGARTPLPRVVVVGVPTTTPCTPLPSPPNKKGLHVPPILPSPGPSHWR